MENHKFISVIIPVYNEEKYIDGCIASMLEQDYPKESMEWFFVDGMSQDATRQILAQYQSRYPALIHVLENPNKTVPYAMNAGIHASKGEYIIRLDAHAEYAQDYFSKCVELLAVSLQRCSRPSSAWGMPSSVPTEAMAMWIPFPSAHSVGKFLKRSVFTTSVLPEIRIAS